MRDWPYDRRLQRFGADMGQELCFQKARAEEICFRIFNVAIHNRPSRRTKAERGLIQSGFSSKIALRAVPALVRV
jgi:hypothetical protein